jgi:hypothetical protein
LKEVEEENQRIMEENRLLLPAETDDLVKPIRNIFKMSRVSVERHKKESTLPKVETPKPGEKKAAAKYKN